MAVDISKFYIRTSGRRVFRRCLRKWGYQSSMRRNLQRQGSETNIHFWFGSAIHFAMEDYFGYNKFGDPRRAYKAYYEAFPESERPDGAAEHYELGLAMLSYFLEWYPKHNQAFQFETLWLTENNSEVAPNTPGAHPAVEQSFVLDLGVKIIVDAQTGELIGEYTPAMEKYITRVGESPSDAFNVLILSGQQPKSEPKIYYKRADNAPFVEVLIAPVCYHGTMDRIVVDSFGRWWILDYKTAKGADTRKLDTDDQISAYLWAAEQWYQHPIYGFVYLQLTKDVAKPPKRLKDGTLSVDKKQKTTYQLFRQEVLNDYGEVRKAPNKVIEMLNHLATIETPEGDRFIRWDNVTRSDAQKVATYKHIMGEVALMVNPNLYLFPNPTRDCSWDCPFREICIAEDDGRLDDAQTLLNCEFEVRPNNDESNHDDWKKRLKWPDSPLAAAALDDVELRPDLFNLILPPEYLTTGDDE